MRILILLHSTTGNTRLMMRHACGEFRRRGHVAELVDVGRPDPVVPDPGDFDLLGVACPTMYFRGTLTMDRVLLNLPPARRRLPAFLFATCGGEPGAQFDLHAEWLAAKGYPVVAALHCLAPSNFPHHRFLADHAGALTPAARRITAIAPTLRPLVGLVSHAALEPTAADRDRLDAFCDRVLSEADRRSPEAGDPAPPPPVQSLHHTLPGVKALGFSMTRWKINQFTRFSVDPARCTSCGVCERLCPEKAVRLAPGDRLPVFGEGCVGCYTCYNHCPEGALRIAPLPTGAARYRGPSPQMRQLFGDPD